MSLLDGFMDIYFTIAGLKGKSSGQPAVVSAGASLVSARPPMKPEPAGTSLLARTWDFITDEAAYAEAVATQDPAKAAVVKRAPRPRTNIELLSEGTISKARHQHANQ